MQLVTKSIQLARQRVCLRPETMRWHKRRTHRRHRRAVRVWLKTGRWVRNMNRPLTAWDLD
ncbi:MAG TPA: hypothetical protein EYP41_12310 [Anaerolineae bacterium]|nr:hypothetical protein [Anaerolineae bacterium]